MNKLSNALCLTGVLICGTVQEISAAGVGLLLLLIGIILKKKGDENERI